MALPLEDRRAREARFVTELIADAQQLVVFRDAIAARRRASLDLACVGCDREVRDEAVLALARAVRNDRGVARMLRGAHGFEGFGQRADLVDLDEDRVRDPVVDAALEARRLRDE